MDNVSYAIDEAACFIIDPINQRFTTELQVVACITTIVVGILTLGAAHVCGILWRMLRGFEEKNETHQMMEELFNKLVLGQAVEEDPFYGFPLDLKKKAEDAAKKAKDEELAAEAKAEHAKLVEAKAKYEMAQAKAEAEKAKDEELKAKAEAEKAKDEELAAKAKAEHAKFVEAKAKAEIEKAKAYEKAQAKVEAEKAKGADVSLAKKETSQETLEKILDEMVAAKTPKVEAASPKKPLEQLSPSEMLFIKHSIGQHVKLTFETEDGSKFVAWRDFEIHIQNELWFGKGTKQKLTFAISNQGAILHVKINGVNFNGKIPEAFLPQLHACYDEALRVTSEYDNDAAPFLRIRLHRSSLQRMPEWHFKQVTAKYDPNKKNICFYVSFLKDDLQDDDGMDSGGLARDYFGLLFQKIFDSPQLKFDVLKGTALRLPLCQGRIFVNGCPQLNDRELSLYQAIGKCMLLCFRSPVPKQDGYNSYVIISGRHFHDALFRAALCLTTQELTTPFANLPLEAKLKMCRALLKGYREAGIEVEYLIQRLDWFEKYESLDTAHFHDAVLHFFHADDLPEEWTVVDHDGEKPDMEKIKSQGMKFKAIMLERIFNQEGSHGHLGGQLAPIHAIAQGMMSFCNAKDEQHQWENLRKVDHHEFSMKVQGSLDRKYIADQFVLSETIGEYFRPEIEKKLSWLQEWIRDEKNGATESDLRNALKFFTGISCAPFGRKFEVMAQKSLTPFDPVPRAHTCPFKIELSPVPSSYGFDYNDHTPENFIKAFKELALSNPSGYQMD